MHADDAWNAVCWVSGLHVEGIAEMNETPRTSAMMQAADDANEDRLTRGRRLLNFARQLETELAAKERELADRTTQWELACANLETLMGQSVSLKDHVELAEELHKTREALRERAEKAEGELAARNAAGIDVCARLEKAQSALDMARDEFLRVAACPRADKEIEGICKRASSGIERAVPLIVEHERTLDQLHAAREAIRGAIPVIEAMINCIRNEAAYEPMDGVDTLAKLRDCLPGAGTEKATPETCQWIFDGDGLWKGSCGGCVVADTCVSRLEELGEKAAKRNGEAKGPEETQGTDGTKVTGGQHG